jgi:hypothetical protein
MKIKYLTDNAYSELKTSTKANSEWYKRKEPWLDEYFKGKRYFNETKIFADNIHLENYKQGDDVGENDLINARLIYDCLKDKLTLKDAGHAGMWTYMTHVTYWEYMRSRWDVQSSKNINIKSRYFLGSKNVAMSKAVFTNGISRLWWGAHLSYDEDHSNRYHLTKIIFKDQNFFRELSQTSFCRNRMISQAILEAYEAMDEDLQKKGFNRKVFFALFRMLSRKSGVMVYDAVQKDIIRNMVLEFVEGYED